MAGVVDLIEPSYSPQPEIRLTDRCKNARTKWWRLFLQYDYTTQLVARSMEIHGRTHKEVLEYVRKRNDDFDRNHPYPLDEIKFVVYTDYVPF